MNSLSVYRSTTLEKPISGTSPGVRRLVRRLIAVVAASIAIAAASLAANPAPAAANDQRTPVAPGDVGILEIIPGTHYCENFGSTVSGYRAGHCADVDLFVNSAGYYALRGQGQTFCQRASNQAVVQCAGAVQSVTVRNLTSGESNTSVSFHCGRYTQPAHSPACPSGRFQHLSPGIYAYCGAVYDVVVRSTVDLPVSGSTQGSENLYSEVVTIDC